MSSSISDFYEGKTIFLTGGTGFLGRLLLSKILRSTNVREIIMLCRPKKGKSNAERLDKILSGILFAGIEDRSKVKIVNGDMEVDGLDLSFDDREYILENSQIILHGAATVKFDEELHKAIKINVRGTKNMLELAAKTTNLISFVHISTAYSQCPLSFIKESFYAPPIDYKLVLKLIDGIGTDELNCLTSKLIHPWPNTYSFSKAISEDMIRQNIYRLPISIIRPSVVIGTCKDPVPGFFDTLLGPLGGLIGVYCGLLRVVKMNLKSKMDIVPADIVVDSVIAISSTTIKKTDVPKIYNCVSTNHIRINFTQGVVDLVPRMCKIPLKRSLWIPKITFCESQFYFKVLYFTYHYVPAFFIDLVMKLTGSKIRLVRIYSKVYEHLQNLGYFMNRTWSFEDANMMELNDKMFPSDRESFTVSFKEFSRDIEKYYDNLVSGARKYFFNEHEETLKEAHKRLFIFKILHNILLFMVYTALLYFSYNILNQIYIVNTAGNFVKYMKGRIQT
ncbi:unnamed protein product [Diamesa serratosioi]